MQMSGQQKIHTGTRETSNCQLSPPNQVLAAVSLRKVEWMMRDQNLCHVLRQIRESLFNQQNLPVANPSTLPSQRASRIDTQNRHFTIRIKRLQIFRNVFTVSLQPKVKPRVKIMQRHVVIPRHHNLGAGKQIEEPPRRKKFRRPRALRKIARHHNRIGPNLFDRFYQRSGQRLVDRSEVKIRKMD
jgi:hypothetical protein